jgi:hypothetical protein
MGRVRSGAVYCDFQKLNLPGLRDKSAIEGFDLIDLPSLGIKQKNSADIKIAVDAVSLAYESKDIDTLIFVTGDADFNPVLKMLRKMGRTIVVIGLQASTASILKTNCDRFIAYEELVNLPDMTAVKEEEEEEKEEEEEYTPIELPEQGNIFRYVNEFKRAYDTCVEKHGEVIAATLKFMIVQMDPAFSERRFGCSSFGEFLEKFEQAGYITLEYPMTGRIEITWTGKKEGKLIEVSSEEVPEGSTEGIQRTMDYQEWLRNRLHESYPPIRYNLPLTWYQRLNRNYFAPYPEIRKMVYSQLAKMKVRKPIGQIRDLIVQNITREIESGEKDIEFSCNPPIKERVYIVLHPLDKLSKLQIGVPAEKLEQSAIEFYLRKILEEYLEEIPLETIEPLTSILKGVFPSEPEQFEVALKDIEGTLEMLRQMGKVQLQDSKYRKVFKKPPEAYEV